MMRILCVSIILLLSAKAYPQNSCQQTFLQTQQQSDIETLLDLPAGLLIGHEDTLQNYEFFLNSAFRGLDEAIINFQTVGPIDIGNLNGRDLRSLSPVYPQRLLSAVEKVLTIRGTLQALDVYFDGLNELAEQVAVNALSDPDDEAQLESIRLLNTMILTTLRADYLLRVSSYQANKQRYQEALDIMSEKFNFAIDEDDSPEATEYFQDVFFPPLWARYNRILQRNVSFRRATLNYNWNNESVGFDGSALILTTNGQVPIKTLQPGDQLISIDPKSQQPRILTISSVHKKKTSSIEMTNNLSGESIRVGTGVRSLSYTTKLHLGMLEVFWSETTQSLVHGYSEDEGIGEVIRVDRALVPQVDLDISLYFFFFENDPLDANFFVSGVLFTNL